MAVKKEAITYSQLATEISRGVFRPIYLLMGEESFYIDDLEQKIVSGALREDERDFNLTICYGVDVETREVISMCKRYPVMAERQVIVVREAQILCKPVIITNYPTAKSQINNGADGIICELDNTKIAEAIHYLAIDKEKQQQLINYLQSHDNAGINEVEKIYKLIE